MLQLQQVHHVLGTENGKQQALCEVKTNFDILKIQLVTSTTYFHDTGYNAPAHAVAVMRVLISYCLHFLAIVAYQDLQVEKF